MINDYIQCVNCDGAVSVGKYGGWVHEDSDQMSCERAAPPRTWFGVKCLLGIHHFMDSRNGATSHCFVCGKVKANSLIRPQNVPRSS